MTELCDVDAVELRRRIGAKEISPVELLDSCLARIAAVNPALNAMVTVDEAGARAGAKAAEAAVLKGESLGALHGLPVGIKDLTETGGMRTTFGAMLFKDNVPAKDERIAADLRRAGAVMLGKTNTPEYGAGANTTNKVFGPTPNPFNLERTCAGSSGGSAVALAASMVPVATGSDMGGSLRTPAAYCGVVGFRPSPGLVPSERRLVGTSPLPVNGPMGRNVPDTALLLAAIAAWDSADPLSIPIDPSQFLTLDRVDLGRLTVAYSDDLGFTPVDTNIKRVFNERVTAFRSLFGTVSRKDPNLKDAHEVFAILRAEEFLAAHLDKYRNTPDLIGPNIRANVEEGLGYTAEDTARAKVKQTKLYRAFQEYFREVDLLICPAAAVPPFPYRTLYPDTINGEKLPSYFYWLGMAYGLTVTGHPVACIPCGVDDEGLPFGIQICGRRYADRFVLAAAAAIEKALATLPGCARPMPDLAALAKAPPAPGPSAFPKEG